MIASRKGQGAMEYLMTYGWAILVVMIVGVVLWQMGVFSNLSKTVNRCNDFTTIKCFDPTVQYTGGASPILNATLTNGVGSTITITKVNATEDCNYNTAGTALIAGGADGTSIPVQAGGIIKFSCSGTRLTNKPIGNPFSVRITIVYRETIAGTAVTRIEEGRFKGFVE